MNIVRLATLCVAFAILALGCSKESTKTAAASSAATGSGQVPSPLLRSFDAYFPRDPGRTWTYVIEIPANQSPITHTWIHSSKVPNNGPSEFFGPLTPKKSADGRTLLVLRSEGETQDLAATYPSATAVAVVRDDLGVFMAVRRMYWSIAPMQWRDGNYVVTQDVKYAVNAGEAERFAVRTLFFEAKPGFEYAVKGENEKLVFVGPVRVDGRDCLQFRRVVGVENAPPRELAGDTLFAKWLSPFTETMWFERDVGLIRLVQTVNPDGPNARVTMTWNLERP